MSNEPDEPDEPIATRLRVGVLALQGDYDAHVRAVQASGNDAFLIRTPDYVKEADALILPGGESTTIGKLMARYGLDTAFHDAHKKGVPIYGTCAGMILLAKNIVSGGEQGGQKTLGLLDVSVVRNAFGRQVDSFETEIAAPDVGEGSVRGVFIRAPYVTDAGPNVQVLARWDDKIVMVRENNVLATAFHPELTGDVRVHQYFLQMARAKKSPPAPSQATVACEGAGGRQQGTIVYG